MAKKDGGITQEDFDKMLAWLDSDRDRAGEKYVKIETRLIRIFISRGCDCPEDLANETINRVIRRIDKLVEKYEGDPLLYFQGVANKVFLEWLRKENRPDPLPIPAPDPPEVLERNDRCLEECMQKLSPKNRELVIEYYRYEGQAKIEHRKEIARREGIALNALRIRAHRIRASLQDCVFACLEREENY